MYGYFIGWHRGRRTRSRVDAGEQLVEGKLDGGARNTEAVVGGGGGVPFPIVHAGRESGSSIEHSRWTKIVGENVGESERVAVAGGDHHVIAIVGAPTSRRVLVVGCVDDGHAMMLVIVSRWVSPAVELGGWLEVWLASGGTNGRRLLVDAKRKLHALDGPRLRVLRCLATALLLLGALSDDIRRVIPLKVWRLKFLDAPADNGGVGIVVAEKKNNCSPSLLLVELVAHYLGQLLKFAFRFGIVRVDDEILQMP